MKEYGSLSTDFRYLFDFSGLTDGRREYELSSLGLDRITETAATVTAETRDSNRTDLKTNTQDKTRQTVRDRTDYRSKRWLVGWLDWLVAGEFGISQVPSLHSPMSCCWLLLVLAVSGCLLTLPPFGSLSLTRVTQAQPSLCSRLFDTTGRCLALKLETLARVSVGWSWAGAGAVVGLANQCQGSFHPSLPPSKSKAHRSTAPLSINPEPPLSACVGLHGPASSCPALALFQAAAYAIAGFRIRRLGAQNHSL